MSQDELDGLKRVFGMLDEDNSGIVTRDELVEMFYKHKFTMLPFSKINSEQAAKILEDTVRNK
jgi:Ca2+-binding EF-hand superfamily protein